MAYSVTKLPDGDLSLGNLRGELVALKPALSDYPPGGYLVEGIGGNPLTPGNVGMDKILAVAPVGGQGGVQVAFNPTTSKVQMYYNGSSTALPGLAVEVPAGYDLSAYTFNLICVGY
jgi:hypothetical protein